MKILTIDSKSHFNFSAGEVHCKLKSFEQPLDSSEEVQLICKDYTMDGFMTLCQYNQMLVNQGYSVQLLYPYLPYSRQDRYIVEDEPFSLKTFCDMLNAQNFKSVKTFDCHSDVAPALINRCINIPQFLLFNRIVPEDIRSSCLYVSPDAGAYKKVSKAQNDDTKIIIGTKIRDEKGNIVNTEVYKSRPLINEDCIVIDDICDGGRTFVELGRSLKKEGARKLYLYITHGIFSRGLATIMNLKDYYDHIYTTDSFGERDWWKNDVTVQKVL